MTHYIYGAGGLSLEAFSILSSITTFGTKSLYDDVIFVVDEEFLDCNKYYNCEIISINKFNQKAQTILLAIGDPVVRIRLLEKLPNLKLSQSIIHPSSVISPFAKIGLGCIIFPSVVIGPGVVIGNNCVIYSNTSINHNVNIDECVTISSNVSINGNCQIQKGAFIGSNACLKQHVIIGKNCIVGMGSVVISNVDSEHVVAGNPAIFKKIRTNTLF